MKVKAYIEGDGRYIYARRALGTDDSLAYLLERRHSPIDGGGAETSDAGALKALGASLAEEKPTGYAIVSWAPGSALAPARETVEQWLRDHGETVEPEADVVADVAIELRASPGPEPKPIDRMARSGRRDTDYRTR